MLSPSAGKNCKGVRDLTIVKSPFCMKHSKCTLFCWITGSGKCGPHTWRIHPIEVAARSSYSRKSHFEGWATSIQYICAKILLAALKIVSHVSNGQWVCRLWTSFLKLPLFTNLVMSHLHICSTDYPANLLSALRGTCPMDWKVVYFRRNKHDCSRVACNDQISSTM